MLDPAECTQMPPNLRSLFCDEKDEDFVSSDEIFDQSGILRKDLLDLFDRNDADLLKGDVLRVLIRQFLQTLRQFIPFDLDFGGARNPRRSALAWRRSDVVAVQF